MKVTLTCEYRNSKHEIVGKYGDALESPKDATADELKRLVASGSAEWVEPPKKSERD